MVGVGGVVTPTVIGAHAMPTRGRRRPTANRQAVLDLLSHSDRFRSAQQVHIEMREQYGPRIGLSTIYRILRTLADEKVAETQRAEDGETLYRLRTAPEHRHYLLCRRCGRAVGFTVEDIERYTSRLARRHRFADVTHYIDIYGTCPRCT
jgi:Fur family ferric uptake transcriptional regulator